LTGSEDRTARPWRIKTGQPLGPPLTHPRGVLAVALSADGQTVATCSRDNKGRLWDVTTRRQIGRPGHRGGGRGVVFNPDGQTVVAQPGTGHVPLWAVPKPLPGSVDRIGLWAQLITGVELDADGVMVALDPATWEQRRQRLEKLGGPPGH